MSDIRQKLIAKLESRQARVGVIGLGYVGLPLGVAFAQAGYHVVGIDVDESKVAALRAGHSYVEDIPSAVLQSVTAGPHESRHDHVLAHTAAPATRVTQGLLEATTDFSVLADCDAVSICVPTPLGKTDEPDISYIIAATREIARHLHPGTVIVLESTTFPGTTSEVILPILAEAGQGLTVGESFFLAFSPERIDPGRTDWTVQTMPKIIGGQTPACLDVAQTFYAPAVGPIIPVSSPDAAEMAKLFENTFRAVNIGLANEMLLMCDKLGLDAWEVLDAAGTKPFGFMKFTPGPGLGGHCIPVDPHYLSWKLRTLEYNARFIALASEINSEMPRYWVQKVQDRLNDVGRAVKNSRILLLGVAYKKNVSDLRESPAIDIIHLLTEKGAQVKYHDPHVPSFDYEGIAMESVDDLLAALLEADCVVITTDHDDYDWEMVADTALIVDTRHVMAASAGALG